ncbi:DUF6916 family protein [Kordiimonas aestuarii]|uniref:DUF6916 family protein n=1 Tax=Kordiimonas aestuarii TaxID=1005925 RepID=UPI0021CEB9C0|nr:hypothetical protein [Kordiimonas aestuarii]
MLEKITAKSFEGLIGTEAEIIVMDGPNLILKVEEIHTRDAKKDDARPKDCRADPFTLTLSGPAGYQVPDGIYEITFEKVGSLPGIYIDNKADNPECEGLSKAVHKAAASAIADAEAAGEEVSAPDDRVLYEITLG